MAPNRIILPLMSLALLTACIDEQDGAEASQLREIDRLVLTNGNLLVFVDEDPSDGVEIGLLEVAATPEPGGAIEEMKAADATPAELWLSMTDKEVPRALEEAHADERDAAPRAFTMPEHLLATTDDIDFRSFAYGGAWGGTSGYCSDPFGFPVDWDNWAGAAAVYTASGTVGGGNPALQVFPTTGTDAWVGVCNDGTLMTNERSKMSLWRDITGGPFWSALLCSSAPSTTFCTVIMPQEGVGMHWWSGTSYPYKAEGDWSGGNAHNTYLRAL